MNKPEREELEQRKVLVITTPLVGTKMQTFRCPITGTKYINNGNGQLLNGSRLRLGKAATKQMKRERMKSIKEANGKTTM